jgi:ABC-type transport system involved in cytochrome c biogenesis permease subunit
MKKWVPWIVVGIFAAWMISAVRPKKEGQWQLREFARLPVLLEGRVQPLDSVARNALLQLRTRQTVPLEGRQTLTAIEWLLEVMARPEIADERKIFRIDNIEVLNLLQLPDKEHYFSFAQISPSYNEVGKQAERIQPIEAEKRTTFEKQLMKLYNGLMLYQRLKVSLRPPNSDDFLAELNAYERAREPGVIAVRASQSSQNYDRDAYERILSFMAGYQAVSKFAYMLTVPPADPHAARDDWRNIGASLMESVHGDPIHPAVKYYATMVSAQRQGKPEQFNQAVQDYKQWLGQRYVPELKKGSREFFFNLLQPFYLSMVVYVFSFVLAAAFWFKGSDVLRRSALYLMVLAWVVHSFGLIGRMVLEGRPPVTNLYSSAIFIGWGAVVLGFVLERIYRDSIGTVVGSLAGFATEIIAHHLARGGDTMPMLRAVLDTNFWLATHVVAITIGYASTFVAGLLAIIYIVRGVFTTTLNDKTAKTLARMVYGIVCFATLFSFIGTVLGGIWADQSWGRFWGWDPKENGALMIVIWNALILHARWGGMIRERGLMNLAIVGNIITSFSWFGVNMLGIGLHSYGFMDAAFRWLMGFTASQLAFIAIGLLPLHLWRSFSQPAGLADGGRRSQSAKTSGQAI